MQRPTVSYLGRTESTQQFHQDCLCCQTKPMIYAAILFNIHCDSKSFTREFTLQRRQTLLNSLKGKVSFELTSKTSVRKLQSTYYSSQITLGSKLIFKKIKIICLFTNFIANCYRDVAGDSWGTKLHAGPPVRSLCLSNCQESQICPVLKIGRAHV